MNKKNKKRRTAQGPTGMQTLIICSALLFLLVFAAAHGGTAPTNHPTTIAAIVIFVFFTLRAGWQMVKKGDWFGWLFILAILVGLPMGTRVNGNPSMAERNGAALERFVEEYLK